MNGNFKGQTMKSRSFAKKLTLANKISLIGLGFVIVSLLGLILSAIPPSIINEKAILVFWGGSILMLIGGLWNWYQQKSKSF